MGPPRGSPSIHDDTPAPPPAGRDHLTHERKVLELLKEALQAAKVGNKSQTRKLLQEVTELDPQNEMAWLWLSGVAESPHEAVAYLNRVLVLNPENPKAREGMKLACLEAGITAAKNGHRALARHHLRKVMALDPKNEEALLRLAAVADTPEEGIEFIRKVLMLNPTNPRALEGQKWFQAQMLVNRTWQRRPGGMFPA